MQENIKATGELQIVVRDANGQIKDQRKEKNLVVTTGLAYIASRMKDATATAMTHMAIGSGQTDAALGQTTLVSEIAGGRVALTSTNVSSNVITYSATFGAGVGTGSVYEAGIFNASSAGTMLCRTKFSLVTKDAADTMTITWAVTLS